MSGAEFARRIADLGYSQSSLARRMADLGDPRSADTIRRTLANYCRGCTAIPGPMIVLLKFLPRYAKSSEPVDLA